MNSIYLCFAVNNVFFLVCTLHLKTQRALEGCRPSQQNPYSTQMLKLKACRSMDEI
jgi:hypothetical protein